jgi:hypothetical protein
VGGLDTGAGFKTADDSFAIGGMDEVPVKNTSDLGKFAATGDCTKGGGGAAVGKEYVNIPFVIVSQPGPPCTVDFYDEKSPCSRGTKGFPMQSYLGGKPTNGRPAPWGNGGAYIQLKGAELQTGSVVILWSCRNIAGQEVERHYEWKGDIYRLGDPSGAVYDARTRRPLAAATVRLEFSSSAGGPFAAPVPLTSLPQSDSEITTTDGRFRWDVADGYWRLKASAFGYHSLTSHVYKVPPEVTGIRLELRPDPAQSRFLIDPAGRVGKLKIGMKASTKLRVSGLRIRVVRGHIRSITVRSRRYKTTTGVRLGSPRRDFESAYPKEAGKALGKSKKAAPKTFLVKKATFTVKGAVTAIKLGR